MDEKELEVGNSEDFVCPPFFLYSFVNLTQTDIKYLRQLQQKKYREAEQKFILEGWRPLKDALHSDYGIEFIAVLPEESQKPDHRPLLALARDRKIPIKEMKSVQLRQLSDAVHSQGVLAVIHQTVVPLNTERLKKANFIVACDRIGDPGNLGTILRTCDWFGVDMLLLSKDCVSVFNEKVLRSTAGSIFHVDVYENLDFHEFLPGVRESGFKILATALHGKPLNGYQFHEKIVLLLGNEAHGVDPKLLDTADIALSIQKYGKAESLNVGIACGIFLEHWRTCLKQ